MAGASVPYALRQNKFVDRRLFIELLARIERHRALDEHVYISMGGATLEDHRLAHAQLGLKKLISFDGQQWVVDRQRFNRPVDYVRTTRATSGELIANFSAMIEGMGFGPNPNVIVWLDFTDPAEIGSQYREFNQLLNLLQEGDIVRLTVNSHAPALYTPRLIDGRLELPAVFQPKRLARLGEMLGEYMPVDATEKDMTDARLPIVMARAMELASQAAFPGQDDLMLAPLSVLTYADGQRMMSATSIVMKKGNLNRFSEATKLNNWEFYSGEWGLIHEVSIPDLTLRERMFINERIPSDDPDSVCNQMGFDLEGNPAAARRYVEQYMKYYRFYPHFHHVQV